jgi:processing peptidase subunit alpha
MNQLIGSAQAFSAGGPGKGMHSRAVGLMQKNNFVDGASALNSHFSDSGLFGMSIEGPGSHSQELMGLVVGELNSLKGPIDEVELNRAKNILKMNILMAMEKTEDRLEEIARNFMTYGDLTFHQYCEKIDSVSAAQINQVATKLLAGKPTLLVTGGAINLVPSVTEVSRQLN